MATPVPTPKPTPGTLKQNMPKQSKPTAYQSRPPTVTPTPRITPKPATNYSSGPMQSVPYNSKQMQSPANVQGVAIGPQSASTYSSPASSPPAPQPAEPVQYTDGGGYSEEDVANQEYNNTMSYLGSVEEWLKGQFGNQNSQIDTLENQNRSSITQENEIWKQQQAINRDQAAKRKEDALSAARRLFAELEMGNRQRFGGSTSAGAAAMELLGTEQMRQQGSIQDQYGEYLQESELAGQKQQKSFSDALQQIASQAQTARQTAMGEFTQKMLDIARDKTSAAQLKAERKLQALQDLRNKQYEINQQEVAYQRQLGTMREQFNLNSQATRQTEQGAFAQLQSSIPLKPDTTYRIGSTNFKTATAPMYVGQIGKFVIGRDEIGRTVYWNPSTNNFDFGWSNWDAGGNMQDYSISPSGTGQAPGPQPIY